jgi:hypothetical protein
MKSIIFWNMTPCSPLSFNRISEEHIASSKQNATCLLAGLLNLLFRPWRWRRYVPPKRRLKLNGLHGVTSQKMILFTLFLISISVSDVTKEGVDYTKVTQCNWNSFRQRERAFSNPTGQQIVQVTRNIFRCVGACNQKYRCFLVPPCWGSLHAGIGF